MYTETNLKLCDERFIKYCNCNAACRFISTRISNFYKTCRIQNTCEVTF
jgi:hypothetical protein